MTSTTVAQHTSQPLNFGPEWLRALSTPDSATSVPTSGGSTTGNIFKFSATKYRYSKDEILALRANMAECLTEATQNEILANLKDVESVFRPDIMEPLALTAPTAEETIKMNALSSYISGRTPGGAGRAGNSSQQSQQDARNNRGGSSLSNGRGGSRGRGGRDNTYGSNRGNSNNNNSDDNGENGNTNEETSTSSWSRTNYNSRGGSFGNRVRSYDDRDQSHTFRRGSTNGSRQSSDGWRRSRGDDDDNNEQSEDSPTTTNGSTSWTSRGGQARRGGGSTSSMEQRTKFSEKWSLNDDRPGPSSSYESNQQRGGGGGGGWRTNSSTSERDFNSHRPPMKRDRMPEWMDDNNDDDEDNHISNATFEQDGTFTRSSAARQNSSNEQLKIEPQTTSSESTVPTNNTVSIRKEEEIKPEKSTSQSDIAPVNVPTAPEPIVSKPTPPVQQQSIPTWDDDFDHSDLATTVVEATLAEDHDYSPPVSAHAKSRLISMEPTASIIPQQRAPVIIDDKQWFYKDPQNTVQGPFSSADMERWYAAGYFTTLLPVKRLGETQFSTIQQLTNELGRLPFRTDAPSLPTTPVQKQQQSMMSDSQKFNPMAYSTSSSSSNNAFLEDYLMQQQSRQNAQQSLLFNRQTSMPLPANERKPMSSPSSISSQLQTYFNSQQQQQQQQQQQAQQQSSSLFSNLASDPAILYQQQLQRSMSTTTNSQQSNSTLFDDMQRSFRQPSSSASATSNSTFFPSNLSASQQSSNDLMARLTQAMQSRDKQQQQQDKLEEQRRRDLEFERMKIYKQVRLQREEEERRKIQEVNANRQINFDQLTKSMENKNQSVLDFEQMLAHQQSLQYQKEQRAKIEAQQAENIRRYQQFYQEQGPPPPPPQQQQQQQQPMYKVTETTSWSRNPSQNNDSTQLLNFAEIQKQEQEQERRSRDAAAFTQQYPKSRSITNQQQSTPWNGTNSMSNPSLQDIQRQQTQNDLRQQQSHHITSGHSSSSTPVWSGNFPQTTVSQQSSAFLWDNQHSSTSSNKSNNKSSYVSTIL
ncbi:hypothetical protein I4U23_001129 [Adineta vaga]|nr:hypothetical protein I4U23_001129 [Adineta vaga]